jgi:hypothetical protein
MPFVVRPVYGRTVSRRGISFLSELTLIVEIKVAYGVSVVAAALFLFASYHRTA